MNYEWRVSDYFKLHFRLRSSVFCLQIALLRKEVDTLSNWLSSMRATASRMTVSRFTMDAGTPLNEKCLPQQTDLHHYSPPDDGLWTVKLLFSCCFLSHRKPRFYRPSKSCTWWSVLSSLLSWYLGCSVCATSGLLILGTFRKTKELRWRSWSTSVLPKRWRGTVSFFGFVIPLNVNHIATLFYRLGLVWSWYDFYT